MKRATRFLIAVVCGLALVTSSASPSSAHSLTLMWGSGQYDVLGTSHVSQGNVVGLWQAFLFSYDQVPCSKFDGIFGSATAQGTRNLQGFWGQTSDGVVGHNTWTEAGQWLEVYGDDGFLTTFWWPAFAQRSPVEGRGRFQYVYGGSWTWNSHGEQPYSASHPDLQSFSSNHPSINFWMHCHPADG